MKNKNSAKLRTIIKKNYFLHWPETVLSWVKWANWVGKLFLRFYRILEKKTFIRQFAGEQCISSKGALCSNFRA